jgi:phosphatidylserine decarboxylase
MSPSVLLQYLLPHRALSRVVYWATRWRARWWKNMLIRKIVKSYAVDMSEAAEPDCTAYPSFNAFFTRALKPGVRLIDPDARAVAMPADGCISQLGPIREGRIFQAKGRDYSAAELLGDAERAALYRDGRFATIYLSPRDYHRMHMPLSGTLVETVHVPGRLFSVAPFAVQAVPRLFARNERLVCHFDSEHGPFAVVLVGAMLVSSVETVWRGLEIPPYSNVMITRNYQGSGIQLERDIELGRFNMGSTVIVLFPAASVTLEPSLQAAQPVRLGQRLGMRNL